MKSLFLVLTLSLVFLPGLVIAQTSIYNPDPDYGLVPCGSPGQDQCTTNHVVAFANNLITWLISILGVIAVIALIITGFKLVTSAGNPSAWSAAKEMFTNIVIGIIIILAAWLVVDTILKGFTDEGLNERSGNLQVEDTTPTEETVQTTTWYIFQHRNGNQIIEEYGTYSSLAACNAARNQLLAEYRRLGENTQQLTVCYVSN